MVKSSEDLDKNIIDWLEISIVGHGLDQLLESGRITEPMLQEIRGYFSQGNGTGYEFLPEGIEGHNQCSKFTIRFNKMNPQLEFLCFGKYALPDEIAKERSISGYITKVEQGITLKPLDLDIPDFIALEFLDPTEHPTLSKKFKDMNENQKAKTLDKLTGLIAKVSQLPLNETIKKELMNRNYSTESSSWSFSKSIDYEPVARTLNHNSSGLIENDLHFSNILVNPNGTFRIIDWSRAMYGCPQTDLARIVASSGYELDPKIEGQALGLFSDKAKISDYNDFHRTYELAKLHQYFELAGMAERQAAKNQLFLATQPDKYALKVEQKKNQIAELFDLRNTLIVYGKDYAREIGVKL